MNCLKCEIRRAKWRSAIMLGLGKEPEAIAKHLSETYGEAYYVRNDAEGFAVMRASKIPPYEPHLIATSSKEA